MKNRNCPNCGAPYDINVSTCPYCGTSYFDMSAIDMSDEKPFYLKIRIGNFTITQLVTADMASFTHETDRIDINSGVGKIASITTSQSFQTDIKFTALVPTDKSYIYRITTE